jgi:hypothetical protein
MDFDPVRGGGGWHFHCWKEETKIKIDDKGLDECTKEIMFRLNRIQICKLEKFLVQITMNCNSNPNGTTLQKQSYSPKKTIIL